MPDEIQAVQPTLDTYCDDCSQPHTYRMHDGPRRTCTMASCRCRGFRAKVEEEVA